MRKINFYAWPKTDIKESKGSGFYIKCNSCGEETFINFSSVYDIFHFNVYEKGLRVGCPKCQHTLSIDFDYNGFISAYDARLLIKRRKFIKELEPHSDLLNKIELLIRESIKEGKYECEYELYKDHTPDMAPPHDIPDIVKQYLRLRGYEISDMLTVKGGFPAEGYYTIQWGKVFV